MKTKNYLVASLYRITANTYGDTHRYDDYKRALEISRKSFTKNLKECDEQIIFEGTVNHIQALFKDHFFRIYDLWKSEKCNILYCGPDTLCINETYIFNKFKNFRMFNYTQPRSAFGFPHFFNADVRYYPHDMSQDIWDMGLEMAENWNFKEWNTEQIILNKMLWSQEMDFDEVYRPDIAFQDFITASQAKDWNGGIDRSEAKILHFAGTRGILNVIEKMNILKQKWE